MRGSSVLPQLPCPERAVTGNNLGEGQLVPPENLSSGIVGFTPLGASSGHAKVILGFTPQGVRKCASLSFRCRYPPMAMSDARAKARAGRSGTGDLNVHGMLR